MSLRIDEVGLPDLVRELSPDALKYFAETELSNEWPSHRNLLKGKFVRLGEIVFLGAAIDFGPDSRSGRTYLQHEGMLEHSFRGMGEEVQGRIRATAPKDGEYLKASGHPEGRWPLVDAGGSKITLDPAGQPNSLSLYGSSSDFDRPNDAIRKRTGEIAQAVLGENIIVIAY